VNGSSRPKAEVEGFTFDSRYRSFRSGPKSL